MPCLSCVVRRNTESIIGTAPKMIHTDLFLNPRGAKDRHICLIRVMLRSMNNLAQEINASHLKGYPLYFSSYYCHLFTDTVTKAHFRVFFPLCSVYGSLFQTLHGWKNDIHKSNFGVWFC